jgi:hypothetical protein
MQGDVPRIDDGGLTDEPHQLVTAGSDVAVATQLAPRPAHHEINIPLPIGSAACSGQPLLISGSGPIYIQEADVSLRVPALLLVSLGSGSAGRMGRRAIPSY